MSTSSRAKNLRSTHAICPCANREVFNFEFKARKLKVESLSRLRRLCVEMSVLIPKTAFLFVIEDICVSLINIDISQFLVLNKDILK